MTILGIPDYFVTKFILQDKKRLYFSTIVENLIKYGITELVYVNGSCSSIANDTSDMDRWSELRKTVMETLSHHDIKYGGKTRQRKHKKRHKTNNLKSRRSKNISSKKKQNRSRQKRSKF
jgi:hypothetical protein